VNAGLLAQLPPCGLEGRFPRCELSPRELPQASQQPALRPLLDQPTSPVLERDDRPDHVGARGMDPGPGDRSGVGEFASGPAVRLDRALRTAGRPRHADRLPELHQRFVEPAGPGLGHQGLQCVAQALPHRRRADVALLERPARRDPQSVRIESERRRIERETRDRTGNVRADARQRLELCDGPGERSAPLRHEDACRLVEVASAGVVSRSLPRLEDFASVGASERRDRREPPDESLEVRRGLRHAGLLQEDLGDPDPVGVGVAAPRQGAAMGPKPPEQRRRDLGRNDRSGTGRGRRRHGPPPEEESH
jgi:hypothetical protein